MMNGMVRVAAALAVVLAVALAGCGASRPAATTKATGVVSTATAAGASSTASQTTTTPAPNTGATVVTTGTRAPTCRSSQLRLSFGPLVSEMTQQHTLVLALRNGSSSTCDLHGYPRIALLDDRGSPLPFRYRDRGDQELTSAHPRTVALPAGADAYFAINKNACVRASNGAATQISVTLPGETRSVKLVLNRYPILDYCPASDPIGHYVEVTPVEPSVTEVFARS